jgi:hypothetical protein
MTPEQDQETREEAARLAELPVADQKQIIEMHRGIADDAKVPKRDRDLARERADSLERHLRRLNRARKRE